MRSRRIVADSHRLNAHWVVQLVDNLQKQADQKKEELLAFQQTYKIRIKVCSISAAVA